MRKNCFSLNSIEFTDKLSPFPFQFDELQQHRPSKKLLALSLQSIESNIPQPAEFIQEQTLLDSHASEIDKEIEQQFQKICSSNNQRNSPLLRKTKSLPKSKTHFQYHEKHVKLDSVIEDQNKDSNSMGMLTEVNRSISMPRKNTSLSTFWSIVDKHGLTPLKPTTYLPDTADLPTLTARLKSGHIQFESISNIPKTERTKDFVGSPASLFCERKFEMDRASIDLVWDSLEHEVLLDSIENNVLVSPRYLHFTGAAPMTSHKSS